LRPITRVRLDASVFCLCITCVLFSSVAFFHPRSHHRRREITDRARYLFCWAISSQKIFLNRFARQVGAFDLFSPFPDFAFHPHPPTHAGCRHSGLTVYIACAYITYIERLGAQQQQLLRLINELRAAKRSGLKVCRSRRRLYVWSEMEESSFMTLKEFCVCWSGECANGRESSALGEKKIKHAVIDLLPHCLFAQKLSDILY